MNAKEFLKKSDENILNVDISDIKDEKGNMDVGAFLTIGLSKKAQEKKIESLTDDQLKNPKITFYEFEVILTKEQLKYLISEIEKEDAENL